MIIYPFLNLKGILGSNLAPDIKKGGKMYADKKDGEFKEHKIERRGQKDLVFEGRKIGEARNRMIAGDDQTRWTEYGLYQTEGEKLVLKKINHTRWQGEQTTKEVNVFENEEKLKEFADEKKGLLIDLIKAVFEFEEKIE